MERFSKWHDSHPSLPKLPDYIARLPKYVDKFGKLATFAAMMGMTLTQPSKHYIRLEIPSVEPFVSNDVKQFHSIEECSRYLMEAWQGSRPMYD